MNSTALKIPGRPVVDQQVLSAVAAVDKRESKRKAILQVLDTLANKSCKKGCYGTGTTGTFKTDWKGAQRAEDSSIYVGGDVGQVLICPCVSKRLTAAFKGEFKRKLDNLVEKHLGGQKEEESRIIVPGQNPDMESRLIVGG